MQKQPFPGLCPNSWQFSQQCSLHHLSETSTVLAQDTTSWLCDIGSVALSQTPTTSPWYAPCKSLPLSDSAYRIAIVEYRTFYFNVLSHSWAKPTWLSFNEESWGFGTVVNTCLAFFNDFQQSVCTCNTRRPLFSVSFCTIFSLPRTVSMRKID